MKCADFEQSFRQLRACGEEFETFVVRQLDELSRLHAEFDQEKSVFEGSVASARSEMDDIRAELAAERQRLEQMQTAEQGSEQAAMDTLRREKAALEAELKASRSEQKRLGQIESELTQARAELAAARQEIDRLTSEENESAPSGNTPLAQRLREAERDRAAIEAELEHVRHRAAEAASALEAHERRMAEERAEWSGELKQLRRTLEHQMQLLAEQHATHDAAPASTPPPVAAANGHAGDDPVLDSVMAQFATLQKDLIRRRNHALHSEPTEAI